MADIDRGIWVKQSGAWKEVQNLYIKDNGVWKPLHSGYVKQNGQWKAFWPDSGSRSYAAGTSRFTIPAGIYQITFSGAAGGGGGGTIMDGGHNDDNGSSGGGSSGQMVRNFSVAVTPGEIITINVGTGGNPGPEIRDGNDTGYNGTDSSIACSSGTFVLYGGKGGGGGSPAGGRNFPGGQYVRSNSTIPSFFAYDGTSGGGGAGGRGGAGFDGSVAAGTNNRVGNNGSLGGGASGVYSGYLRQDRGIPGFRGGYGGNGFITIYWGPNSDPNFPG